MGQSVLASIDKQVLMYYGPMVQLSEAVGGAKRVRTLGHRVYIAWLV